MLKRLLLQAAPLAGFATRFSIKRGPGLVGAACVAFGAGMAYLPLAPIVAGVFMLLLDRKAP